jgi:DNA polymerase I-like protein with 3'-5' exonuclease and polymerase domains
VEELRELKKESPDKWDDILQKEMLELSKPYVIGNQTAYDIFQELSPRHGIIRKMESDWLRLALNNPIQTTGSHMIKRAMVEVYGEILRCGHYGQVLIWNFPYDEMCLMAPTELAEHYRQVLENAMRTNGDMYLKNLKIKADAATGMSWYEAK